MKKQIILGVTALTFIIIIITGFRDSKIELPSTIEFTCDPPLDIALFRNGGGPPVGHGDPLLPNSTYLVKLQTGSGVYACYENIAGFTPSKICADVNPNYQYNSWTWITTNADLSSGVSITIRSYCPSAGGSATFNYP